MLRDSNTTATTKLQDNWGVENDIRRKELELARDRGSKVVEIKV